MTANGSFGATPLIELASGTCTVDVSAVAGFTVKSFQELKGSGRIVGAVSLAAGACLTPGNSVGTLTFQDSLVLAAGATNNFELGDTSNYDRIVIEGGAGALNLNNVQWADFNFTILAGFDTGDYTLIQAASPVGSFDGATNIVGSSGLLGYLHLGAGGNDLVLTVLSPKASQTITFPAIADQVTTNLVGLVATGTSGLPVTFGVGSGSASITGGTNLSFSAAGTVSIVASQSGDTNWNAAPNITNTFMVSKTPASVTLTNLNQTYTGSPLTVGSVTVPASLPVGLLYDGSPSAPTTAGSYVVTGSVNDVMYQGAATGTLVIAKAGQVISFPAIAGQVTTNIVGLVAMGTSGLPVTFGVGSGSASITGGTNLSFSAAGTVSIVASQSGGTNWYAAPNITNTFTVSKTSASVTLTNLNQTYTGSPLTVGSVTIPVSLPVDILYDGTPSAPTSVGSYSLTGTVNDVMYQGGATGTLVIAKAGQIISFPFIADQVTTNIVGLVATGTSGLPVTFGVGSGSASISGGTNLSFSAAGTVSIVASQSGNTNWNAAPNITNTFMVRKTPASVTLTNLAQTYTGSPLTVGSVTVPASLPVDILYEGTPSAPTTAGSYVVTGSVNDVMYQGAATGTLVIAKAQDTITFGATNQVYNGGAKSVTAVASSGSSLTVTYAGSPAAPVNAGSYVVTGIVDTVNWQATNTAWLSIARADQGITNYFPVDGAQFVLGSSTTLSAQAASGLAVTFSNLTPGICVLAVNSVSFTNPGLARVQAQQAGSSNWNAALPITHDWRVGGLITNLTRTVANVGGGVEVVIQGIVLGNGSDVTSVTLAGVQAMVLTQSVSAVTVLAGATPEAVTGAVTVVSVSGGFMVMSNAFTYQWLDAPVQYDPVDITGSNLMARWATVPVATRHYLEAGLDTNFTTHLSGYEHVDVALASQYPVSGLTNGDSYALRLYAWNTNGYSLASRTVWVPAGSNTPYETHPPASGPVTRGTVMEQALTNMFSGTGLVYTVESSDTNVVAVSILPYGQLRMQTLNFGFSIITVRATHPLTGYTASYRFRIDVVGTPSLVSSGFLSREPWNPRFTQVLQVRNEAALDAIGIRVLFTNLMPGITVENRTGTAPDGRPMIEMRTPFPAGGTLGLSLVYLCSGAFRVDQHPPILELQYILPSWVVPLPGTGIPVSIRVILPDATGRILVEFESVIGREYAVEYANSLLGEWTAVPLRLKAMANRTQWIDAGPPATLPNEGTRFYQVKDLSN